MTIAVRPNFANMDRDPYWNLRSLGLHFDGANGSTSFPDNSPRPKTIAAVGNAQIVTSANAFGGAQLSCDGVGDYLGTTAHSDYVFGAGDFTVSGFATMNTLAGIQWFVTRTVSTESNTQIAYRIGFTSGAPSGAGIIAQIYNSAGTAIQSVGGAVTVGQRFHWEVCRAGNNLLVFVDGILVSSVPTGTFTVNEPASVATRIGSSSAGNRALNGFLDDLLIYKGVALHTTDFRPPQRPFANR